jgi:TolB protein
MRAMIAPLGAICVLTTLTACSSGNAATSSPAARTAASATASSTLAVSAVSAKPRDGLIAFMRPGTAGEYDIWVVRPDGTGLRRVTESPVNRSDYYPAWSPDGSALLFERRKLDPAAAGGDEALYAVNADGAGFRQITHCRGECWSDGEAAWSPRGDRIAFSRATGPRSAPGPSLVAIDVATVGGSHVQQLTRPAHGYEDHLPAWSPDGRTIVFQRDTFSADGTAGPTTLMAADLATGTERVIYRLPSWAPGAGLVAFAPDGRQILFGFWCIYGDSCPASSRSPRNATLATIHPDGRGLRMLRLETGADSGTWSPDGKRIAFRCHSGTGPTLSFKLCTSTLNGTGFTRFPWPVQSAEPDWGTRA